MINESEQDSNISSYERPIHICRPMERCRSFIQDVNVQAKDKKKIFWRTTRKNRKIISLLKVPLKSEIKIKPSVEGNKFAHLKGNKNNIDECNFNAAFVMTYTIKHCNKSYAEDNNNNGLQFAQTHSAKKGLKKFSKKGQAAALKEITQLRRHAAFEPADVNALSQIEGKREIESLIFLTEKRDSAIKGWTAANNSVQRSCMLKEEANNPVVVTKSLLLCRVIDAK